MAKTRMRWVASVSCEGGPILIADLPDFAQWTGAATFTELREASQKMVEQTKNRMTTLHYWGQFTDRLPAPYAAAGGHQYLKCATEAEAKSKLAELVTSVKARMPKVELSEEDEQIRLVLPGKGDEDDQEMWAELAPKSEYDASWQAHQEEDCWIHAFGKSGKGMFYDIQGGGVAQVGVTADATEIVLVRSWVDEDDHEAEVKKLVDVPSQSERAGGEIMIPSGKALIIWSPVAPFQVEGIEGPQSLTTLGDKGDPPELDTEVMAGVGTVLRVKPGRWAATVACTDDSEDHDDESWSCRWLRLTWKGQ